MSFRVLPSGKGDLQDVNKLIEEMSESSSESSDYSVDNDEAQHLPGHAGRLDDVFEEQIWKIQP